MNKFSSKAPSDNLIRKRAIIAFLVFFALAIGAYQGWKWLYNSTLEDRTVTAGVRKPLRKVLNVNEDIFGRVIGPFTLVKTYPKSAAAKKVRVNGNVGLGNDFHPVKWKLQVIRNPGDTLFLTLDDLKKIPKQELVFDFKCVEGWSQVSWWGGIKFSDFVKYYHLDKQAEMGYAAFATPDKKYYVGIDMPSAMHPQTLLCYEMNGKPLPLNQGYPLRLIIPVKYGIKNIKLIGTLSFSNQRPKDYWAERGYDYYAGL